MGSGMSRTDRTMLKITVLPPRQTTSVASTVSVKLRSRVQLRIAKRASRSTSEARSAHGRPFR